MDVHRSKVEHPELLELLAFLRSYIDSDQLVSGQVLFDVESCQLDIMIKHEKAHISHVRQLDRKFREFDPFVISFARVFWNWSIWDGVVYIGQDSSHIQREDSYQRVKLSLLKAGFKRDQVKEMMSSAKVTHRNFTDTHTPLCNEITIAVERTQVQH
jgi:hypothetical protein